MFISFENVSYEYGNDLVQSLYSSGDIKRIDNSYHMIERIDYEFVEETNSHTFHIISKKLPDFEIGDEIITYGIKAGLYKGRLGKVIAVQDTTVDITFDVFTPSEPDDIQNSYRFGKDAILHRDGLNV